MQPLLKILAGLVVLAALAILAILFIPHAEMSAVTTPEACHAAAIAAATKTNPTNVPCDWKKVLDASPVAALNGRYEAVSEGISGRMVVVEAADRPARIAISTQGSAPRYICTAALEATRTDDTLAARPPDAPGCEVTVRSAAQPGIVTLTATEACASYCNLRGNLGADFKLLPH